MEPVSQLTEFGKIFIFMIMGGVIVALLFFLAGLIAPKKPTYEKLTTYECGEEPVGNSWIQFDPKFYVIALIFLLFDVEIAFIFPWATVFGNHELIAADSRWGWVALIEMFVFVGILLIGLLYVWKKGDLDWIRPNVILPEVQTGIPADIYNKLNLETHQVKPFNPGNPAVIEEKPTAPVAPKPAFKPVFRKPSA